MSNFASSKSFILKDVRLQWADIYTARAGEVGGKKTEPKFKVVALFKPDSEAAKVAKAGLLEAATALWGANAVNVVQNISANSKFIRNGNSKIDDAGAVKEQFKDMLFVSASNKTKPQIVGPAKHNGKFVQINEDGTCSQDGMLITPPYPIVVPYRGCYVNLKIQAVAGKAFKAASGEQIPNQVYAKLEAIQFLRDGEAFGAGPTSAEGFDDEEIEGAGGSDLMGDDIAF